MVQQYQMNKSEKELLTILGSHPELPAEELVNHTHYKRVSSIVKKIERFKKLNMLWGPIYQVDCGKLCKNSLRRLFCIIEVAQDYETVISYLKVIEPLVWVYPVLSSRKQLLSVGFFSSDTAAVSALLQLLTDNNIITDYIVRDRCNRDVKIPPNFFGDPIPSLDTLLDPCDIPDISFGQYEIEWTECDIRTLSYLQGGYESTRLIDILKKERGLHKKKWKYEQLRNSFEKMLEAELIEKMYYMAPYPLEQCADFFLFLKTEDITLTQRILYNFGRGGRIYREYSLYEDWGLIGFVSHPLFVLDLMHKLDQVDEIEKKELYHVRSIPPGIRYVGEHTEFKYYDVDTQTLEYPYHVFEERIKEKLESESG